MAGGGAQRRPAVLRRQLHKDLLRLYPYRQHIRYVPIRGTFSQPISRL